MEDSFKDRARDPFVRKHFYEGAPILDAGGKGVVGEGGKIVVFREDKVLVGRDPSVADFPPDYIGKRISIALSDTKRPNGILNGMRNYATLSRAAVVIGISPDSELRVKRLSKSNRVVFQYSADGKYKKYELERGETIPNDLAHKIHNCAIDITTSSGDTVRLMFVGSGEGNQGIEECVFRVEVNPKFLDLNDKK